VRTRIPAIALVLVAAGCASSTTGPHPSASPRAALSGTPLPPAPEPAVAPVPTGSPAGRVVGVGSPVEGIAVDDRTRTVVAALRDRRLALLDAVTGTLRRTVVVPGTARHLQLAGSGGPVLAPGEDTDLLVEVGLPHGDVVSSTRVGRQPHDAAYDPLSHRVVVTDELAGAVSFLAGGRSVAELSGPVQPGGLAVVGGRAGVVDVRGAALFVYDVAGARQIARLPAGDGPTHAVALPDDRLVVADTRGNALLGFALGGTPHQIFRLPLTGNPYGIAVDEDRRRVYVALSASNEVVRLDEMPDGSLRRVGPAVSTVRQANSLGVDPRTGILFIGGADFPGSVQVVPAPTG
jgi:DNA-binding beta-propeller fold protein YncE